MRIFFGLLICGLFVLPIYAQTNPEVKKVSSKVKLQIKNVGPQVVTSRSADLCSNHCKWHHGQDYDHCDVAQYYEAKHNNSFNNPVDNDVHSKDWISYERQW